MKVFLALCGLLVATGPALAGDATLVDGFCRSLDIDVASREFVAGRQKLRVVVDAEPTACAVENELDSIHIEFQFEYSQTDREGRRQYEKTSPLQMRVDWGQTVRYIFLSRGPLAVEDVFVKRCYAIGTSGRRYKNCDDLR